MQFDKVVEVYRKGLTKVDDFGGYEELPQLVGEVSAFLTPVSSELTIENNVIVKVDQTKLFSNDDIPSDVTLVKCDGKAYEVTAYCNFGKVIMLKLVEA